MLAEVMSYGAYAHPGPGWADGHGPWDGGPGWWLIFPVLFWLVVLSSIGYLIYRRSPVRSARSAAERILAELYARGEISEEELRQRRAVLRGKS
ncbi:putative membrane protein [Micromonospora rhizosphaerae]|uniref:Putative membrane protein n=1 Tax=Micromonospora rhizosphaerae TaxID=568872 RepID=A0A1C6SJL7_9ACTN|nr:SHOCT domain-containing protein [Micromonospora rhizosphaerae]SCL29760.1 putative membrane protein [Micromonospora rhizosphaerae]